MLLFKNAMAVAITSASAEGAEKRPHRVRPQAEPAPKEHHRKPIADDDDDEFEFGFLNWDEDEK